VCGCFDWLSMCVVQAGAAAVIVGGGVFVLIGWLM
jgi:hypothetical protein